MKKQLNKVIDIILNRASRNILFWLVICFIRFKYYDFHYTATEIRFFLLTTLILLSLLYINNLLLIPKLFVRKKYLLYFPLVIGLIVGASSLSAHICATAVTYISNSLLDKVIWIPIDTGMATYTYPLLFVIHTFIFFIYTFIFSLLWYSVNYQKKQKEIKEVMKKQTETELAFLKNQLNPHFLFNTLNNLYALALKKADNTPNAILMLSLILRYLLYESDIPRVSFEKEKKVMRAYIELELLRLKNTDNFSFMIEADKDYQIPPLLWLPVLENIFKHGTRNINSNTYIKYSCTIDDNVLHIYSQNTFKPNQKIEEDRQGVGMNNLRKRLSLLYPNKHSIDIQSGGDIYTISITIQLT